MKLNINRAGSVYLLLVFIGLVAVIRIIDLQFIHKPDKEFSKKTTRTDDIPCTRGSILADDGRYLAFSLPEYRLCMDCAQSKDTLFYNNIDALSRNLAAFYKDRSASSYKKLLTSQRKSGRRYTIVNKRLLSYQQMKEVCSFPILNSGKNKGGCIIEKYSRRQYPYDNLALRALGHVQLNTDGKAVGIEGSCDSILRGTPGIQPMRLTEHYNWIEDNSRENVDPVDGTDIRTTINVDIQDIAERALLRQLRKDDDLEGGTTIVMEVETGEIKAMVNMRRSGDGTFSESFNYAIAKSEEPGSVFKLTALTILLDEGKISLDDRMEAVVSWKCGNARPFVDNYLKDYDIISVRKAFEISSNNVFRMLVHRYYGDKPQYYVDQLNNKLRICENFEFDIEGLSKAHARSPKDGSYWSTTDLPQLAIGYAVKLTPLHTLTYYNAIANGGVMMKPYLIREFSKDGVTLKKFEPTRVCTVCKSSTVSVLKEALRGVVTDGTGRGPFAGCPVEIAGKTGTARKAVGGKYKDNGLHIHQSSFAGFFPCEHPRYSIITVLYTYPTSADFYGGKWAAPVVREIAEAVYAGNPQWNTPLAASGTLPQVKPVENVSFNDSIAGVPDVVGMGLRDALRVLEGRGYNVTIDGRGKIVRQVPPPGETAPEKNVKIILADASPKS